MATKIILNRKNEWRNRARGFKVWIDGKEVGTIADGGSEAYPVEPGTYKLIFFKTADTTQRFFCAEKHVPLHN